MVFDLQSSPSAVVWRHWLHLHQPADIHAAFFFPSKPFYTNLTQICFEFEWKLDSQTLTASETGLGLTQRFSQRTTHINHPSKCNIFIWLWSRYMRSVLFFLFSFFRDVVEVKPIKSLFTQHFSWTKVLTCFLRLALLYPMVNRIIINVKQ